MTTVAIMQPTYLPWLGYFDLIRQADHFVFLDHVQFSRQSWQQRNRIRDRTGELMLSIPVGKGQSHKPIHEVQWAQGPIFPRKHLRSIYTCYGKASYFDEIFPPLEKILSNAPLLLADLNIQIIHWGMDLMGLTTPTVRSSAMEISGNREEALIAICEALDGDRYLSTPGARDYLDESTIFEDHGIELQYHQFDHPEYPQQDHPTFISHLAFIDYLMNQGPGGIHQ